MLDHSWRHSDIFISHLTIIYHFTDLLDFLRYTPSAILILLIRLYFTTFTAELTAFRQRNGIITRFEKADDIEVQQSLLGIPDIDYGDGSVPVRHSLGSLQQNQNVNHVLITPENGVERRHSDLNQFDMRDPQFSSPFIVRLNISHFEFKKELETILFPYRNMCRSLRLFFLCNLILNGLCFVFVVITTLESLVHHQCHAEDKYYLHYVTEMTVYFVGWVLLMIPLAENHRALRSLNRDVKARVVLQSSTEQVLVHQYLDSLEAASPFAIGYIAPTYYQLMLVFYVLTFVVGGQLISFFVYDSKK